MIVQWKNILNDYYIPTEPGTKQIQFFLKSTMRKKFSTLFTYKKRKSEANPWQAYNMTTVNKSLVYGAKVLTWQFQVKNVR